MEVLDITFSFLNTMVPSASYGIDASLKKKKQQQQSKFLEQTEQLRSLIILLAWLVCQWHETKYYQIYCSELLVTNVNLPNDRSQCWSYKQVDIFLPLTSFPSSVR